MGDLGPWPPPLPPPDPATALAADSESSDSESSVGTFLPIDAERDPTDFEVVLETDAEAAGRYATGSATDSAAAPSTSTSASTSTRIDTVRDRRSGGHDLFAPVVASTSRRPASLGRRSRRWLWALAALLAAGALVAAIVHSTGADTPRAASGSAPSTTTPGAASESTGGTETTSGSAPSSSEASRSLATIPPTSTESANSGPATSDQTAPGTDEPTTSITASSPPTNNDALPSTPWPRGVVITVGGSTTSEIVSELGRSPIFIGKAAIAISFPDGGGTGVMWQRASGPTAPDGSPNSTDDTDIVRVLPDGRQLILYSTRQGQWLRLHDVAVVDGAPVVLYSVRSGTTPQTTVEVLKLARPASASNVDLGVIGGWESGTGRLHIGGNLIVGEASSGASHSMFALTTSGQVGLDPRSLGVDLSYGDCSDCPHSFTISPDGATVAWIDKSDLVIETLGQIAGARRVALPAAMVGRAGDLQIRGDAVVFNPEPTGSGPQAAIAIDIASGIAAQAPIPGVGSLT